MPDLDTISRVIARLTAAEARLDTPRIEVLTQGGGATYRSIGLAQGEIAAAIADLRDIMVTDLAARPPQMRVAGGMS